MNKEPRGVTVDVWLRSKRTARCLGSAHVRAYLTASTAAPVHCYLTCRVLSSSLMMMRLAFAMKVGEPVDILALAAAWWRLMRLLCRRLKQSASSCDRPANTLCLWALVMIVGMVLLEEAGGRLTDWCWLPTGGGRRLCRRVAVCSSKRVARWAEGIHIARLGDRQVWLPWPMLSQDESDGFL